MKNDNTALKLIESSENIVNVDQLKWVSIFNFFIYL